MPQVSFQFRPKTGESGRGLIKAFRFGLVMPGGSRMVLDLAGPARIDKVFVLDAANDQPARLVLDLAPMDREGFMRPLCGAACLRLSPAPCARRARRRPRDRESPL